MNQFAVKQVLLDLHEDTLDNLESATKFYAQIKGLPRAEILRRAAEASLILLKADETVLPDIIANYSMEFSRILSKRPPKAELLASELTRIKTLLASFGSIVTLKNGRERARLYDVYATSFAQHEEALQQMKKRKAQLEDFCETVRGDLLAVVNLIDKLKQDTSKLKTKAGVLEEVKV